MTRQIVHQLRNNALHRRNIRQTLHIMPDVHVNPKSPHSLIYQRCHFCAKRLDSPTQICIGSNPIRNMRQVNKMARAMPRHSPLFFRSACASPPLLRNPSLPTVHQSLRSTYAYVGALTIRWGIEQDSEYLHFSEIAFLKQVPAIGGNINNQCRIRSRSVLVCRTPWCYRCVV